jgi:hypothetical protein
MELGGGRSYEIYMNVLNACMLYVIHKRALAWSFVRQLGNN